MKLQDNKGAALISAMIVLVVMSLMGVALVHLGFTENIFAAHQEDKTQAYYVARSGAAAAAAWLSNKDITMDTVDSIITTNEDNVDTWTDFEGGRFKISFPVANKYAPVIQSVGEFNGQHSTVNVSLRKKYFFMAGLTVLGDLNIKNFSNTTIDSDVALGPLASISDPPNSSFDVYDVITGEIGTTEQEFPPIVDPGLVSALWTPTNIISPGDGYADKNLGDVNLGSTTLDINLSGDMEIQFTSLTANNATVNVNGTGNLLIYVDVVNFKGNLTTSDTATATLFIFDSGIVDFQTGSSIFEGNIYAPGATVTVSANFGSIGAIVADVVNLESGGTISYDSSYSNLYPEDLGFPSLGYAIDVWSE